MTRRPPRFGAPRGPRRGSKPRSGPGGPAATPPVAVLLDHALELHRTARLAEAESIYRRILALAPGHPDALNLLGLAALQSERPADGLAMFDQAIRNAPAVADFHNHRGLALQRLGRTADATASFRKALAIMPLHVGALANLAGAMLANGEIDAAIDCYRRALDLQPGHAEAFSNYLLALNYDPGAGADFVLAEHRRFEAVLGIEARGDHRRDRDPARRLKVGYVSPDLCEHSCAFFVAPLLAAHDRTCVDVFCYAAVKRPDATTARLRGMADHWRDIAGLDDAAAAALIERDGIDILVDLAGHTAGNRLPLFARKPAPVQVSWLGYPNTTGLRAIDYRLTDESADPPGTDLAGADGRNVERLIRLPGGFLCYQPPADAPDPAPPPVVRGAGVTFGSFNNSSKISAPVVELWAGILARAPASRLVLKARQLESQALRQHYAGLFSARGIAADRLVLLPWTATIRAGMAAYDEVDIALDTFPYNGTTTTCEALWMGVPVVTLAGDRHASRVGASLLRAVGLAELVTESPAAYLATAVALADSPDRIRAWRRTLRAQVAASPLCDSRQFAAGVETAFRTMWHRWCAPGC